MKKHTFSKAERLRLRSRIDELFRHGDTFNCYPFRILTMPCAGEAVCHQVLITVPKRNFKKATQRNLLKRRIREAYRTRKERVEHVKPLCIGFLFTAREPLAYEKIREGMEKALERIRRSNQEGADEKT